MNFLSLHHRLSRGGVHLLLSLSVVGALALLIFGLWYPAPFLDLSGGLHLFGILVGVDLLLGPLATVIVSAPNKPRREWRIDIALIVIVQLCALCYGMWIMLQARPVYLAFELDRFRVVNAVDIDKDRLPMAPAELRSLPISGPKLIALREFANAGEKAAATMLAMQGVELSFRPELWMPYENAKKSILEAAKPLQDLANLKPDSRATVEKALIGSGATLNGALYLPLHGRDQFWTVVISPIEAKPIAYINLDPY